MFDQRSRYDVHDAYMLPLVLDRTSLSHSRGMPASFFCPDRERPWPLPPQVAHQMGSFPATRLALLEKGVEKRLGSLVMSGEESNHECQGDMVCGGRAPREHVLDRAGATKLLRWQPCRLAAHGRRGGVPMKRSERTTPASWLPFLLHQRLH